jgi:hypothetical protein
LSFHRRRQSPWRRRDIRCVRALLWRSPILIGLPGTRCRTCRRRCCPDCQATSR